MKRHAFEKYSRGDQTLFEISDENRGVFKVDSLSAKEPSAKESADHAKRGKKNKSQKKGSAGKNIGSEPGAKEAVGLRIIGGKFRGSKLLYVGDNRVRPMKDRVREAVFNLIGPTIKGMYVVDLFGGTGALTIEAISRGAIGATVIEMHLPTASMLKQNLDSLGLSELCVLRKTDAFFWAQYRDEHPSDGTPWIVFCSPPYDFYVKREREILDMLDNLLQSAPAGSLFVMESDNRFDVARLPIQPHPNKIRSYPPAEIAIFYKDDEQ